MKRLSLTVPFLLLAGCGDVGITWPEDDSQYAVVVGGQVTRAGTPHNPPGRAFYGGEVRLFTREYCWAPGPQNCTSSEWTLLHEEDGYYVVQVPLEREPVSESGWCGTRVRAKVLLETGPPSVYDTLVTHLSAATAVGGDCSGKRHLVNFDFPG